jgi:enoyl-CoA hydratase/carnithine racemase
VGEVKENPVTIELHEAGWAALILNRPERKNAITGPLGEALSAAMSELNDNDAVRVILLRGAGGAFCSGLDLKEFNAEPSPAWLPEFQHIWRGAHRALFNTRKPLVGALERYAINGGAALALACDLLVVGEQAFLQVGEAQIGMAAPYNLAWLSLRHTEAKMAELALIGERQYGPQLLDLGLAHACVADAEVLGAATELCRQLAGYPPGGLERIKAGLRARLQEDADSWFDRFTGVDPVGSRPRPRAMR